MQKDGAFKQGLEMQSRVNLLQQEKFGAIRRSSFA